MILEEQGILVSLLKMELKEMTVRKTSLLPAVGDSLTADELADLLAYLRSLKPVDQPARKKSRDGFPRMRAGPGRVQPAAAGGAQMIADRLLEANANRTTGSPTRAR